MFYKKLVLLILMLIVVELNAFSMNDEKESNGTNCKHHRAFKEEKDLHDFTELSPLYPITPGIYKSDDMGSILSFAISHFKSDDCIIFDVDEALMTGYGLFYQEISKKYKDFYKVIFEKNKPIGEKLVQYMLSHVPSVLMDERTPILIEELQSRQVKCIANTSIDPLINEQIALDLPSSRIQTLHSLNIDFSKTFSELHKWTFNTVKTEHMGKDTPLFKEGIIFSAQTPKHITTYKFLKKIELRPKRILFIDDSAKNAKGMFNFFSSKGIECYSLVYYKKNQPLENFFEIELFNQVARKIEFFFENLLIEEKAEGILQRVDR